MLHHGSVHWERSQLKELDDLFIKLAQKGTETGNAQYLDFIQEPDRHFFCMPSRIYLSFLSGNTGVSFNENAVKIKAGEALNRLEAFIHLS